MSRSYRLGLLAVVAGVVALGLLLPPFGRVSVRGPQTKSLSNAKQLATSCRRYADDHGGKFPVHLSELEPDYVPSGYISEMRCEISNRGKNTEIKVDWLYFGDGFDDTNPPSVLIASPQTVISQDGRREVRVYILGDTTGVAGKEADYQALLATTVQQIKKKHAAASSSSAAEPKLPVPKNPSDF